MAFSANSATVAQWLVIAPLCGLSSARFAPLTMQDQAETCATQAKPSGAPSDFVTACTAAILARGIIYYKNAPGDCGSPTAIVPGETQEIASGISAMAGAIPLPGIGSFVNAIVGIFGASHTAAVQTEQSTICQVAGVINQCFAYYDAQVRSGTISPSTAIAGMQAYIAQVSEQLQTIEKPCNAACVYQGQLAAQVLFLNYYYPAIAPADIFSSAPGAAPSQLGTAPGGVIAQGEGVAVGLLGPAATKLGLSTETLLLILLALLAVFGVGYALL